VGHRAACQQQSGSPIALGLSVSFECVANLRGRGERNKAMGENFENQLPQGGCSMRTTLDLIGELEQEARNFDLVALAVVLEEVSEFVFNSDRRKVERLAYLLGEGGQPVGFIGTETRGNTLRIRRRVLDEYKDKLWAAEYLTSVTDLFLTVARSGAPG